MARAVPVVVAGLVAGGGPGVAPGLAGAVARLALRARRSLTVPALVQGLYDVAVFALLFAEVGLV